MLECVRLVLSKKRVLPWLLTLILNATTFSRVTLTTTASSLIKLEEQCLKNIVLSVIIKVIVLSVIRVSVILLSVVGLFLYTAFYILVNGALSNSRMTLSITTLDKMTLSSIALVITLNKICSINCSVECLGTQCHSANCSAECLVA